MQAPGNLKDSPFEHCSPRKPLQNIQQTRNQHQHPKSTETTKPPRIQAFPHPPKTIRKSLCKEVNENKNNIKQPKSYIVPFPSLINPFGHGCWRAVGRRCSARRKQVSDYQDRSSYSTFPLRIYGDRDKIKTKERRPKGRVLLLPPPPPPNPRISQQRQQNQGFSFSFAAFLSLFLFFFFSFSSPFWVLRFWIERLLVDSLKPRVMSKCFFGIYT